MANLLQPISNSELQTAAHTGRSTTALEKLSKMFAPTDFVKVINPDTEPYMWQWLPPQREEISFEGSQSTVPQRIMYRGEPEAWKLEAGQSGTIVGGNAYVMIDGLVKKLMAKRAVSRNPNMSPGQSRNFNFSDDVAQIEWINQIFLGIDSPFETQAPVATPSPAAMNKQIDEDLGL